MLRVKIIFWINVAGISVTWEGRERCQTQWKKTCTQQHQTHTHTQIQNGKYLTLCVVHKDNVIFRIPLGICWILCLCENRFNDIWDFLRILCIYLIKEKNKGAFRFKIKIRFVARVWMNQRQHLNIYHSHLTIRSSKSLHMNV